MISRIARAIMTLILLAATIFLAVSIIPILRTDTAHASYQTSATNVTPIIATDNQTATGSKDMETEEEIEKREKQAELSKIQPWDPKNKIYPALKEEISNLKPTDYIGVFVMLEMDSGKTLDAIDKAIAQIDKTIDEISAEIRRRDQAAWEEFKSEVGGEAKANELIDSYSGDSGAISRYREIQKKHGADSESENLLHLEIERLGVDRNKKVTAVLEEQYGEIQARATQAIEALPDTKVIDRHLDTNTLYVSTKVGNIETLTKIPGVWRLYDNPANGWVCISPAENYIPILLYPGKDSLDVPVDQPSFSWSPYKEAAKYKFVLAKDSAMTQLVKEAEVTTTSYEYDGALDYSTDYFWRIYAIEPVPSDWSATFSFQTEAAPVPSPDEPLQSTPWTAIMVLGLITGITVAIGLITWLLVTRGHKTK